MRTHRTLLFSLLIFSQFSIHISQAQPAVQSTIKTVYIVPSSHYDLGFEKPPEDILEELKPHVDEIIENAEANSDFRFTIEDTWHILEWYKRTTDKALVERFANIVRRGQVQISMTFGSMHSEFMSAEALNRIVYDWHRLSQEIGIESNFAMMNDVPGFITRLPQILATSGVQYFVNGSNLGLGIGGGTSLYPGNIPFYWQAPDGNKVLMWQTQGARGGYTEAIADYWLDPRSKDPYHDTHFYPEEYDSLSNLEIMQLGMQKLTEKYAAAGYQHDAVMILHSHDFVTSDWVIDNLLPSVEEWNNAGLQPALKVATAEEFFEYLVSQNGEDFPTYQGEWSGLWSEAKLNSPGISASARWSYNHLLAAEKLWTILDIKNGNYHPALQPALNDPNLGEWYRTWKYYPAGNIREGYYTLNKYAEHSGSGQTGWPGLMTKDQINRQNGQYVDYVTETKNDVATLINDGLLTLGSDTVSGENINKITVFNPLSWSRTDVLHITAPDGQTPRLTDTKGNTLPVQHIQDDVFMAVASDIPSVGYRQYNLAYTSDDVEGVVTSGSSIENDRYRIEVNPDDGSITSIVEKSSGHELVKQDGGKGFNDLMRWTLLYEQPMALGRPQISIVNGAVAACMTIARSGTLLPETKVLLYHDFDRIEFINTLDRSQMPFVAQTGLADYYSFLFPFNFETMPDVMVENGAGFHQWPDDYLPGARNDGAVPQHAFGLFGAISGESIQSNLSFRETFFAHLPAFPVDGRKILYNNTIRASVMRKFDQGVTSDFGAMNFPSVEPGLSTDDVFAFALNVKATERFDPVSPSRLGWEFNSPLLTRVLPSGAIADSEEVAFFSIDREGVEIIAVKPSESMERGYYILRLQEITGVSTVASLTSSFDILSAHKVNMLEGEPGFEIDPSEISVDPFETCTIQVQLKLD